MVKTIAELKHIINGKEIRLYADVDTFLTDVKEALFQFVRDIVQLEDNVKAAQEAASNPESPPIEGDHVTSE